MRKRYLGLLLLLGVMSGQEVLAQQQPNIILITVDDMGWSDSSYPFDATSGSGFNQIETPNISRLAAMGVAFTSAYASPVCTPSRISMLTGMNAARHQVTNWTAPMKDKPTGLPDELLADPIWNYNGLSVLQGEEHTAFAKPFPQVLKDAGYFTIHVGKGHWAAAGITGSNPLNLGFVVNVAGTSTGRPQSYLGTENFGRTSDNYHGVENLQAYFGKDVYLTEAITQEALRSLSYPLQQKLPFFLHLGHFAVHDPYQADPRFYQKYLDKGMSEGAAKYASMLAGVDKSLGDVLDYLSAHNVLDNTYILFISDNGGLSLVPPREGEVNTHNKPFRAGKGSVYEGGIRVPFIVKGKPGDLKDIRVGESVIVEDIFPTILQMAKLENAEIPQQVDGASVLPYVSGTASMRHPRALLFHMPHKWVDDESGIYNFKTAIVKGHYKLIFDMKQRSYSLYDLQADPAESINQFKNRKFRKIKAELLDLLRMELASKGAQMPTNKATGEVVQLPVE